MFNKIMVATDSPTVLDGAVYTAAEMAALHGSELYVLHVLESSYSGKYRQFVKHFQTGQEVVADERYVRQVKEEMERGFSETLAPLSFCEVKVTPGIPWEAILRWAREIRPDLIVLGAHSKHAERMGLARFTGPMGSTVEGVIVRERCPVLVVNEPARREQLRFQRVLASVDFSIAAQYALQFAIDLAEANKAHLYILHVTPSLSEDAPSPGKRREDTKEATYRQLRDFARNLPKTVPCELLVLEGAVPHTEILKFAGEKQIDLIVMGSHTPKEKEKTYVGSVVESVSCGSMRPVIVVNTPRALFAPKRPADPGVMSRASHTGGTVERLH